MANHSQVKDSGAFFTIVPETREVKVPPTNKVIGVVGDHLAEQLTFEIPQTIDGHDIAGCARRYVSWLNVDGKPGSDELVALTERPEGAQEGMLYFTWTIRDLLAAAKGMVQFSLHFEDVSEDGATVLYHWGTTACKNCEILDSINVLLATYAAIYVVDDTLIISDYTPVVGGTLALEMPGIIPEGTLEITEAGVHDVGPYAQVKVVGMFETPTIEVDGETGMIKAKANGLESIHQLGAEDDPHLVPGNILKGCDIFGVSGTYAKRRSDAYLEWQVVKGNSVAGNVPPPPRVLVTYDAGTDQGNPIIREAKQYEGVLETQVGALVIIASNEAANYSRTETRDLELIEKGSPASFLIYKVTGENPYFYAVSNWS